MCKVSDPLLLHIYELEGAWCGVTDLGLEDCRSEILGQRKSTKTDKRGSD